ncbi:MAG: hypothetical protein JEZ08_16770 [Clostridiales bacterium]|nr:hypothetical protein [Clostridiales bacterium]
MEDIISYKGYPVYKVKLGKRIIRAVKLYDYPDDKWCVMVQVVNDIEKSDDGKWKKSNDIIVRYNIDDNPFHYDINYSQIIDQVVGYLPSLLDY